MDNLKQKENELILLKQVNENLKQKLESKTDENVNLNQILESTKKENEKLTQEINILKSSWDSELGKNLFLFFYALILNNYFII